MQIQSLLLSEASGQRDPEGLKTKYGALHQELLHWKESWDTNFMPSIASEQHGWHRAARYIETWGSLQYNAGLLMILKHSQETTELIFNAAKQVVTCCGTLIRKHQQAFCALHSDEMRCQSPVFPFDWTLSHLLFAAAVPMFSPRLQNGTDRKDWDRTARSCLKVMALVETDPANLSMGFSDILESLYGS